MNHILSAHQFTKAQIEKLLAEAEKMESSIGKGKAPQSLAGKIVACLFFEPSTRTRLSFEASVLRLGGQVLTMENGMENSSAFKGESLEDTTKIVQSYADCIVARHPESGSVERMAKVALVPVINAGDGGNQHPTQALLDLYTIKKEKGRLDNLRVAFGFDPKHSRTIRSLALLLTHFPNNIFTFICPPSLSPTDDVLEDLKKRGAKFSITENLKDFGNYDVFYANRLQEERFTDHNEFESLRKKFVISKAFVQGTETVILDPLPRIDEIETAVDDLPNASYFRQAKNGLYIRAALLLYALGLM